MRKIAALLCLLTLLSLPASCFSACRKTEDKPAPENETEIADPNILTHVWRETAKTSEKIQAVFGFLPYYDRETKTLTLLVETSEETGDDGADRTGYSVLRIAEDGSLSETASFTLPDEWIFGGFADRDSLTCNIYRQDENGNRSGVIGRYDYASGTWTRTDDILSLFANRSWGVRGPVTDASGQLIVAHETAPEILVLSADGRLIRSILPETGGCEIAQLVASEDGRIFASLFRTSGGYAVAEVFPDEGRIGDPVSGGSKLFGGTDGCPYYYATNDGVFARAEDGGADRMFLSYANSGLSWAEADFLCVTPKAVYLSEFPVMGNRFLGAPVSLYVPGEDIDLRMQQVLTLAYFDYMLPSMTSAVNAFNRAHPEARIVAENWAEYNTTENPLGGYGKLAQDMITGTASPDILVGVPGQVHMKAMLEHGLYLDLMPYAEADDTINPDNLFGCVKRLFDDGKGGLWGITPGFTVSSTLVSTPEFLGEYADKGYWTISETLDYIESLPEECTFMTGLYRTKFQVLPLLDYGNGYMSFVDREAGTCSFDSLEFVRYLNFDKSLPLQDEYNARSPYAGMNAEELAEPCMKGLIRAAGTTGYSGLRQIRRLMMAFGTKDWVMIGYPAAVKRAGAGTSVSATNAVVVSSSCAAPDLAWDFIRRYFAADEGQETVPSLKTAFDALAEEWYERQFEDYYILHEYVSTSRPKKDAITEDDLMYPGMLSTFDPEDRDKFAALFDEIGVTPAEGGVQEIYDILYEEVSAFLSGVGTAEDCAKKIQSRVSIWLSENG